MKKIFVVVLVVALSMIGASLALAGVSGGPHDLSSTVAGVTSSSDEVCIHCHSPHVTNTLPLVLDSSKPSLYNRAVNSNFGKGSDICMSCHDGAIANVTNAAGRGNGTAITYNTSASLNSYWDLGGGDSGTEAAFNAVGDNHPVGLNASGTGWVAPQPVADATTAGFINDGSGNYSVECMSCHEPHNMTNGVGGANFLRQTNTASALCLECHDK